MGDRRDIPGSLERKLVAEAFVYMPQGLSYLSRHEGCNPTDDVSTILLYARGATVCTNPLFHYKLPFGVRVALSQFSLGSRLLVKVCMCCWPTFHVCALRPGGGDC